MRAQCMMGPSFFFPSYRLKVQVPPSKPFQTSFYNTFPNEKFFQYLPESFENKKKNLVNKKGQRACYEKKKDQSYYISILHTSCISNLS